MIDLIEEQRLKEAKRIERVLSYQRWLYVPALLLTTLMYDRLFSIWTLFLLLSLVLTNVAVWFFSTRSDTYRKQLVLGWAVLIIDTIILIGLALFLLQVGNSFIIAAFFLIVTEASVRFGLKGSLIVDIICAAIIAFLYKVANDNFGVEISFADYMVNIGIMSFVSLMVGMSSRNSSKLRESLNQLARERALIEERHRMSNELHDSVLKSLQGLSLEAYAFGAGSDDEKIKKESEYIAGVCQQLSHDIRNIILELREDSQKGDISDQLQVIVNKYNGQKGLQCELECSEKIDNLPLKLRHDLIEITQEALHNVIKHSSATSAKVTLKKQEDELCLIIRDNGEGFKEEVTDFNTFVNMGKIGLASIKERTDSHNGILSVDSSDQGTVISVTIPLKST